MDTELGEQKLRAAPGHHSSEQYLEQGLAQSEHISNE